jgi:hypothetical protein
MGEGEQVGGRVVAVAHKLQAKLEVIGAYLPLQGFLESRRDFEFIQGGG